MPSGDARKTIGGIQVSDRKSPNFLEPGTENTGGYAFYAENVKRLKDYVRAFRLEPPESEKKAKIVELAEVRGIGPKTAKKITEAGVENTNELASSDPFDHRYELLEILFQQIHPAPLEMK